MRITFELHSTEKLIVLTSERWEMPSHCLSHNSHIQVSMGKLIENSRKLELIADSVILTNIATIYIACI